MFEVEPKKFLGPCWCQALWDGLVATLPCLLGGNYAGKACLEVGTPCSACHVRKRQNTVLLFHPPPTCMLEKVLVVVSRQDQVHMQNKSPSENRVKMTRASLVLVRLQSSSAPPPLSLLSQVVTMLQKCSRATCLLPATVGRVQCLRHTSPLKVSIRCRHGPSPVVNHGASSSLHTTD